MRRLLFAALVAVAFAIFDGGIVASGQTPNGSRQVTTANLGPWSVEVSVAPLRVGRIEVRASHVRAKGRGKDRYLAADLVFRNGAEETATFEDRYRTSAFAKGGTGDQLLVADEGCGYVVEHPGDPVEPGVCQAYLDSVVIEPGRTGKRTVTAQRGLRGMTPLSAGHYEFTRHVHFRFAKGGGDPADADLIVSFDVSAR